MIDSDDESWRKFAAMLFGFCLGVVTICTGVQARFYLEKSAHWCDWCENLKLEETPVKFYDLQLCKWHYAKATIVGPAGKNTIIKGFDY
jgi:hypothetical protein